METTESSIYNDIVKNIWLFCVKNKIWLTSAQIHGAENVIADYESRKSYKDAKWMLNPAIFEKAIKHLKSDSDLDCFASRLNTQLTEYTSYKPDLYTYLFDALSVHRGFYNCYLFPPFNLIGRTLHKIHMYNTEVAHVVPKWPTQPQYTSFQGMLSPEIYVVTPHNENLPLPQN